MKRIAPTLLFLTLLSTSCTALQNWLFDASDYHLIPTKTEDTPFDEQLFWEDMDFDFWNEEMEY